VREFYETQMPSETSVRIRRRTEMISTYFDPLGRKRYELSENLSINKMNNNLTSYRNRF